MFVRFRAVRHRLVVNLVASRRVNGKIVSEHIVRLGSAALPEPISPAERILFWRDLRERWRDLVERMGNRVTADDRKKALAAIHQRIPKPTEAEFQDERIYAARKEVARWEKDRDNFQDSTKGKREMIAKLEADIAELRRVADLQQEAMLSSQGQFLKLSRGQRVEGDDALMFDQIEHDANLLIARRRHQPRPAARGRRGQQKHPRWLRWREEREAAARESGKPSEGPR